MHIQLKNAFAKLFSKALYLRVKNSEIRFKVLGFLSTLNFCNKHCNDSIEYNIKFVSCRAYVIS